jgi:hypothetical protein
MQREECLAFTGFVKQYANISLQRLDKNKSENPTMRVTGEKPQCTKQGQAATLQEALQDSLLLLLKNI